jgi:hypothetical protein
MPNKSKRNRKILINVAGFFLILTVTLTYLPEIVMLAAVVMMGPTLLGVLEKLVTGNR